jgi:hypothetical protein
MGTRLVTATYLAGDLQPLDGRLVFRPVTRVILDEAIMLPDPISVTLDDGRAAVHLQTTDTGAPAEWTWQVLELVAAAPPAAWQFTLPPGDPIDLADLSPVGDPPGEWQYQGPRGPAGPTGPQGPAYTSPWGPISPAPVSAEHLQAQITDLADRIAVLEDTP